MKVRENSSDLREKAEAIIRDNEVRERAGRVISSAAALQHSVKKRGLKGSAQNKHAAGHLSAIAHEVAEIARRSTKQTKRRSRSRVWPFAIGGGLVAAGVVAWRRFGDRAEPASTGHGGNSEVEQSVDLAVPVREAYNQWTQFEEFPRFMDGVDTVQQLDDTHLLWRATVAGQPREWRAKITEQMPDERIAWRALDGSGPDGVVTFHHIDDANSRVMVQIRYAPERLREKAGSAIGLDTMQVKGDLRRFKDLIEGRGVASGAWRGEVDRNS
ncbi:MAG: hypothetical protein QOJ13_1225 [Gaiellales bacterium]|jgi:uncharacterized membrane protein|nr:hypothetical protein [Gaiellales bacterium]